MQENVIYLCNGSKRYVSHSSREHALYVHTFIGNDKNLNGGKWQQQCYTCKI